MEEIFQCLSKPQIEVNFILKILVVEVSVKSTLNLDKQHNSSACVCAFCTALHSLQCASLMPCIAVNASIPYGIKIFEIHCGNMLFTRITLQLQMTSICHSDV